MGCSAAWRGYLDRLREVAQLLVADPESRFGKRQYTAPQLGRGHEVRLSAALTRGALVLTCSHLQGFFLSVVQEFLESIDRAELNAGDLPPSLRSQLCLRFPFPAELRDDLEKIEHAHRNYASLWVDDAPIPQGTIRTESLGDPSANPWPSTIQSLLENVDVDIFDYIGRAAGSERVNGIKTYVKELVKSRNKLAHGDDSVQVTSDDVRRLMQWSTRFARATDQALGAKLEELTGNAWTD